MTLESFGSFVSFRICVLSLFCFNEENKLSICLSLRILVPVFDECLITQDVSFSFFHIYYLIIKLCLVSFQCRLAPNTIRKYPEWLLFQQALFHL
jgi:hypothetical protein